MTADLELCSRVPMEQECYMVIVWLNFDFDLDADLWMKSGFIDWNPRPL